MLGIIIIIIIIMIITVVNSFVKIKNKTGSVRITYS